MLSVLLCRLLSKHKPAPSFFVDQFLGGLDRLEPILEAVPERIDLVFVGRQQSVIVESTSSALPTGLSPGGGFSNSAIPSRSMPDKNFQTAPCGNGRTKRTKRTKRGLIATPVNATLGVDLILPLPLGTILSPLSPFLSAGYGQKIILGTGSALPGVQDQRQKG